MRARHPWRLAALLLALALAAAAAEPVPFRFVILGDRTGEAAPGVFEQVSREASLENPAFVLSTGDLIEGMRDGSVQAEWREFDRLMEPFRGVPFYAAPGNHDVWSEASAAAAQRHSGRALHFSFDYQGAHFTVLDNSRSDDLPAAELAFLETDLQAHAAQPLKFVVMHRPSWLTNVAVRNTEFALHRIARKYGVRYVIAGHLHQLLRFDLEGVTYVSMVSSGGHLRASAKYEDGWFFGYGVVEVAGDKAAVEIRELKAPHGEGRTTNLGDWGMLGLVKGR
ncbi:MAG TPA: metallophosphoesterase [Bryobacteraceae bacterium]|nr:metallophosphoesterase [Bryobacteraceae bacterium]